MEKKFIKLNKDYNNLCIGNLVNVIKEESKNKTSAIQSEVFSSIFNIDYINESTVNNYCIGARSISDKYKQIYINLKNKYKKDHLVFIPIIKNILTIINGSIYNIEDLNIINNNIELKNIVNKLYNISKNDLTISKEFTLNINKLILNNLYYDALVEILIYIVLEKKQPIYESDKIKNTIENIITNTNISSKDLQDFLMLELDEGINFSYQIRNLANNNNAFANYQIGLEYYRGEVTGEKDYILAYKYFKKASDYNHPSAYWMIANMIYEKKINLPTTYLIECLNKSINLGNTASINTLGLCYLNGIGVKKNISKALELFNTAASKNYAYAYNNLGHYYENIDYNKSIEYYKISASLGESYALNKVGLYYLETNPTKAFDCFNKGIDNTLRATYLWNYHNLAKYFYSSGNIISNTSKDINKAIKYYNISSSLIESLIELLYLYINIYKQDKTNINKSNIKDAINRIENHPKYNNKYKSIIEKESNILINSKLDINI